MTFKLTFNEAERRFKLRLRTTARDIREAAHGKTCGGCAHYAAYSCTKYDSLLTGNALHTQDVAIACASWKTKTKEAA